LLLGHLIDDKKARSHVDLCNQHKQKCREKERQCDDKIHME
jgi:hypothetical protein